MKFAKLLAIWLIFDFSLISAMSTMQYPLPIESFETYSTGTYPDHGNYVLKYWFPNGVQDPIVDIVEDPYHVYHGDKSVRLEIDGNRDDGSVWLLAEVPVSNLGTPLSKINIELSAFIWSTSHSDFNRWPVLACINDTEPTSNEIKQEEDFTIIGYTEEKAGWTKYNYTLNLTLPKEENATFYFAFGISATWETVRTYWIDYIVIITNLIDQNVNKIPSLSYEYFIMFFSIVISICIIIRVISIKKQKM